MTRVALLLSLAAVTSAFAGPRRNAKVTASGETFLAVWQDANSSLAAARVSPSGEFLDSALVIEPKTYDHAECAGEPGFLIAWSTTAGELFVRRMSRDRVFLDSAPSPLGVAKAIAPSIAWTGSRWFVVWYEFEERGPAGLFGAFIEADGTVGPPITIVPPRQYFPATNQQLAWNGRGFLITWSAYMLCDPVCYSGPYGVIMMRLTADGTPIDAFNDTYRLVLRDAATHQLASNGSEFIITYDALSGGVRAARVRTDGEAIEISDIGPLFDWFVITSSALTWDGSQFLLATLYDDRKNTWSGFGPTRQWLSLTHLRADGTIISREVKAFPEVGHAEVSVAAGAAGMLASTSRLGDLEIHAPSSFHASRAAPHAPHITSAVTAGRFTHLEWTSDEEAIEGFAVQQETYDVIFLSEILQFTSGTARSADLSYYREDTMRGRTQGLVARAFNEGGVSPPSNFVRATVPRQRAVGR